MWKRGIKCLKEKDRRFTKRLFIIANGIIIMMVLGIILSIKNYTDIKSEYDELKTRRFVFIQDPYTMQAYGKHYGITFDLKKEEFFGYTLAIKDKKIYGTELRSSPEKVFEDMLYDSLTSIILNLYVSIDEIRQNNFRLDKKMSSLVDKKRLKEKFPPEVEQLYKKKRVKKVRIYYNKKNLPIEIKGHFKDKEKSSWRTIRKISYPKMDEKQFTKKMNEYIQYIKNVEAENEED